MGRYKTGYLKAFFRAMLVLVLTVIGCLILGILAADLLDYLTRNTNSFLWPMLFQFFSNYRVLVVTCVCILMVVIFSNWVFAPVFNSFATLVAENLQVSEEEGLKPPKMCIRDRSMHHIIDASLAYYMEPIIVIFIGADIFKEKLTKLQ